ncbi:phosphogluconate dehydratase [Vibrio sp. MACH09]|uniref:phosphogluconate dehydratase n=1 Tax=Vibrio sp. MACH09 TaxID=3025122 RepID=UPI00279318E4|nr:phosphogluconate dehydratase [Vibrio sp. MACH09]GLO59500.1 phosphogluconate dehydratase [Vibrio sp. MACH09]
MNIHPLVADVASTIIQRSLSSRKKYLATVKQQADKGKQRANLSCGNLAHTVAASSPDDKKNILDFTKVNLALVTSYNDMVSAHQPYKAYPDIINNALAQLGHTAQVAGGVPAMCDGITQGNEGMELSLFSRDLIAQSTALSLSHNTFDGTLLLGVCDKIAPGQLMGALAFGHLVTAFVPSGPMATGISNKEKVRTRQQYLSGKVNKQALQHMECQAYHSAGTCTFFGTANTNQLVLEAMGLMLPGSAFVQSESPLRQALTEKIALHIAATSSTTNHDKSLANVVDEKSVVNGLIALLASGGSTNHTIHLIAIAKAAGWIVTWDDLDKLSTVVPLLVKMYPNGPADINAFQSAGGVPALLMALKERKLLFMDANPVYGTMDDYLTSPYLTCDNQLKFRPQSKNRDPEVISISGESFSPQGGLKVLSGNLGRGIMKVSAVSVQHQHVRAPAKVFDCQHDVEKAYKAGKLNQDAVIVVRFNGPASNGMPELHKLMPILANLMDSGFNVALLTDGRLSGASGKVPAVIHITPEAARGGLLAKLQDGDDIELNGMTGTVNVVSSLEGRLTPQPTHNNPAYGSGRELFSIYRDNISSAEQGASILYSND